LADLVADSLPTSVGQGKFASHRLTFYHCATQNNQLAMVHMPHVTAHP